MSTNEQDRELLELAAKAAGKRIDKSPYNGGGAGNTGFDCMGNAVLDWHNGKKWNPLTDDGDALRLAVKLGILIAPPAYNGGWEATASAKADDGRWIDETLGTHGESTRRAIVRAAAAIGGNL